MKNFWNLATIAIGGVIVADFLIHPQGTSSLFSGINSLYSTATYGLLGGK